ncbi:ParA family protein [Leuconostoc mesenteroides]|uniref:CobQ/CobB/MinD/ParA nucleotide binding domain protein n=2 Tax=Leuconostoc mesenteroides TaxID=1245 RepID=C2KH87_LEUMC|nr:ParA family protein [Leuconostoc mesenteroides]EEJ43365.1 CobQ/CobB/MinD/ParA nucleotide binding domain protein [Leuconostoc mesenteroides subsp. cremoris ATCC 19254]MDG9749787.1 ParA family protein [Leuconostoc mesenteroides]GEP16093.1 copy number control protein [Leuconostoc mesenteroides subsp. cremoris]
MTKVITTGNFKGGVGKTTNSVMLSYTLSKMDKKVLLIDLDPQANATDLLLTTMTNIYKKKPDFKETLFESIKSNNPKEALINVKDNFDLLPSYSDLQNYERFLYDNFSDDYSQDHHLTNFISKIKNEYDFVFLDIPPQLNKFTDNALVASDFVIVILQTQERALKGAEKYIDHLLALQDDYNLDIDLLGILPVLQQNGSELDLDVLQDATESFGDNNIFKTHIKQMNRLKRFDRTGITDNTKDIHDKRIHAIYSELIAETLERITIFEKNKEHE